jgi:hypothetical protein
MTHNKLMSKAYFTEVNTDADAGAGVETCMS